MKLSNLNNPSTQRSPSSTNLQSSRRNNDWSTYHLYTMRKSVDEKGKLNTGVRQQLKMQQQNSQKLLQNIQSSMLSTQQTTVDFLTRLQQQKCKNQQLTKLVSYYQGLISQQKLQKHNNVMMKIQTNRYDELKKLVTQREKQLQVVTGKLNGSQCEKNIKYEVVKAQRRERILNSNQFNSLQKETFGLVYKYKQQLIQRVLLQKQFQQYQYEMTKTKQQWQKQLKAFQQQSTRIYQQHQQQHDNSRRQSIGSEQTNFIGRTMNNFTNTNIDKQTFYRSRAKINYNMLRMERNQISNRNQLNQINQKRINNLEILKVVKDVLNQLGVGSFCQLRELLEGVGDNGGKNEMIRIDDDKQQHQDQHKEQQQQQNDNNNHINNNKYKSQLLQQANQKQTQLIEKLEDQIYQWSKKIEQLQCDYQKLREANQNYTQSKTKRTKHKKSNSKSKHNQNMFQVYSKQLEEERQSIISFNTSEQFQSLINLLEIDDNIDNQQLANIDINLLARIQQKFTELVGHSFQINNNNSKYQSSNNSIRAKHDRRSIVNWELPYHMQKQSNVTFTQKSICPLLQPTKGHNNNSKKMKTGISQQVAGHNGLKKLSNLLKNQSKMRGPIDVVSKQQMIQQAQQAFDKEGLSKMEKFQVKYT